MYKLMVSYDTGYCYNQHMESEDLEALKVEGAKFDEEGLRWVIIENKQDDNDIVEASLIHKQIITFMDRIRRT